MKRRPGVLLVVIVPLAFAAVSGATTIAPVSQAKGPITSLTSSGLTVQANAQVPTSCTRTSASPTISGFKVGDMVRIQCKQGALVTILPGGLLPATDPRTPVDPIAGLPDRFSASPAPGAPPTAAQCAAAWNSTSPPASRDAIAGLAPLAAQVVTGTDSLSQAPPDSNAGFAGSSFTSSRVTGRGPVCSISFVLPGTRTASAIAAWKHGTARSWSGFILPQGLFSFSFYAGVSVHWKAYTTLEAQGWFWVSESGTLTDASTAPAPTAPPSSVVANGPITTLTPSRLTVQANGAVPATCRRTSSSPSAAGFKVGETVTISCKQGVLVTLTKGLGHPSNPITLIPGMSDRYAAGPAPTDGPRPTRAQCAAAWNATAPLRSQQALGAMTPLAARVSVNPPTISVRTSTGVSVVATVPTCSIAFVLPGTRTAEVGGPWNAGMIQAWVGSIRHGGPAAGTGQGWFRVSLYGTLSSA